MANYSIDDDLIIYHAAIATYGSSWDEYHALAKSDIDRDLDYRWYRKHFSSSNNSPFDASLINGAPELFRKLSCFKTLSSIFGAIGKGNDAFDKLEERFRARYEAEFSSIVSSGLTYNGGSNSSNHDSAKFHVVKLVRA